MEEASNAAAIGIAERIKQARTEAGLTQDQLADLIEVGMRQVQYYEAGESDPYRRLAKIAEVTGKSVGWLLHGDPVTPPISDEAKASLEAIDRDLRSLEATVERMATATAESLARLEAAIAQLSRRRPPQAAQGQ